MKTPHPYTRDQIKTEIQQLKQYLDDLSAKHPDDQSDFNIFKKILEGINGMMEERWPLSIEQRKSIAIGWLGWRVFEGGPDEDLPRKLSHLHDAINADMTQEEEINLLG
jgi:hypothetical protein